MRAAASIVVLLSCEAGAWQLAPPLHRAAWLFAPPAFVKRGATRRTAPTVMQQGRDADDVAGAVGNTFGDIFSSFFKPNAEREAEIDRAYAEQLEVAERRRNPKAYARKIQQTEKRRAQASREAYENIAWQRGSNPLEAFKKRQQQGKVKKLGYEDEPKGGLPLPSASFGVGGEFGVGGKYDNGQRFDVRALPPVSIPQRPRTSVWVCGSRPVSCLYLVPVPGPCAHTQRSSNFQSCFRSFGFLLSTKDGSMRRRSATRRAFSAGPWAAASRATGSAT